jgi:carbon monoxide dehydrogenase subunit G
MVRVSKSTRIDAPREQVFEFLDVPENHATITPSLRDIRNVQALDNGGKTLEYTYKMAGIGIDGQLTQTVHDPPSRHVFALESGLSGELAFELEAAAEQTTVVTATAEYEIPGRVLSAVAEPFVKRYNARELATVLENLRDSLEVDETVTA